MTTKQLNYKALPILSIFEGSTSPTLTANDKGVMAFGRASNKLFYWDGTQWRIAAPVTSINGRLGTIILTKTDVGLGSVDDVSAASLRDRTTHTGVQEISTITGLQAAIDGRASSGHSHSEATSSAGGFMSMTDKAKLDALNSATLLDRANHTGAQAIATVTGLQGALDTKASTGHTHANASPTVAGFMSNTDKAKLDGIAAGATAYTHPTVLFQGTFKSVEVNNLGHVISGSNPTTLAGYGITDAAASSHTHSNATTTVAGFMSNTDKTKLDGIAAGANAYAHPANHPASIITQDANNRFVTDAEKTAWNAKIGTVKTINGQSIVGSGDLVLAAPSTFATDITVNGHKFGRGANSDLHTNVAVGMQVLSSNTTGDQNTATGFNAMQSNTTGYENTAYGCVALRYNTTGNRNTAYGSSALGANTTGNSNTAFGFAALGNSQTSSGNTAYGSSALYSNTTGSENTAIGPSALSQNTTGYANTATGQSALNANKTGDNNTAYGVRAMQANTTGSNNTAVGSSALMSTTTGVNNTATGFNALKNNTYGNANTASGYQSLFSNFGGPSNTATGYDSLYSNTTGSSNTAFGICALYSNTTSNHNVALGAYALYSNTTGRNNTAIGSQYNTDGFYSPVFNCTTHDNRVVMAHTGVTHAYIQVPWTVTSDARDKTNFAAIPHGLEFVKQLKPTAYQFKVSRNSDTTNGDVRYGFKAQDIAAIEPEGIIVDTSDKDLLRYNESNLIPILVKAIQELSAEVAQLKARL